MKLNKYQTKALGLGKEELPQQIWNSRMLKVYERIDSRSKDLGDDGQTYHEFLEMEKQEPNEEGTGRYKFETISKIQYFFICKGQRKLALPKTVENRVNRFLTTYLRIPTHYNSKTHIYLKGNSIIDKQKNLEYFIKHEEKGLDVYDMMDMMMQYRLENTILLGITESNLQENGDSLDGRACGDGVAVIGFEMNDLDKNIEGLLQTVLHETLHTLGFDHCVAWKCLMNAWTNFVSWLCPACSRKLYHQLKLKSKVQIQTWLKEVVEVLEQMKCKANAKRGRDILKSIGQ